MPEPLEPLPTPPFGLLERLRATPGLAALVAEAEETWRARAAGGSSSAPDSIVDSDGPPLPAWRAFEDAFPTFYEFTNRPR